MDITRKSHAKGVPSKYIFFLRCCYDAKCIHPKCQAGRPQEEITWFAGGPPIHFLPLPLVDPNRPYPGKCEACKDSCFGHYMKYDSLLDHYLNTSTEKIDFIQPPSVYILNAYRQNHGIPDDRIIKDISKNTLLPVEEVLLWLNHLHKISQNRQAGAKKAAETKKRKKDSRIEVQDDEGEICQECGRHDPLNSDNEVVPWISCDGCLLWWHTACSGLVENYNPEQWLCISCTEVW
mgnify:CR=1 FL=1